MIKSIVLSSMILLGATSVGHSSDDSLTDLFTSPTKSAYTLTESPTHDTWILDLGIEIGSPDRYTQLLVALNNIPDNIKTIKVYTSGNGGYLTTAEGIISSLQASNRHVVMVLNGDAYSASAMIAISGNELLLVNPYARLMFHVPAIQVNGVNIKMIDYCNIIKPKGTDRGINVMDKCKADIKNASDEYNELIDSRIKQVLTSSEYQQYLAGYDVYVKASDVIKRSK